MLTLPTSVPPMLGNISFSPNVTFPVPIYPGLFPPPRNHHNHSTPRIFHGIGGGDPSSGVFTSGGVPIGQGKACKDLNGREISSGLHFVPGPDECTLCVCEDGGPKWCKAVLCSPPQDCKSFRVGSSCCDFICLDDTLSGKGNGKTGGPFNGPLDLADVVPKIIVVAITAILSLSLLLFLIHRLRQKQIQGRLNSSVARRCDDCDDTRSLDFSLDFYDRGPPPPFTWWKPPSYFPPRGEAPPPYEEAIASTSNCLPMTFTNAYNNNSILNSTATTTTTTTLSSGGIATTSLTSPQISAEIPSTGPTESSTENPTEATPETNKKENRRSISSLLSLNRSKPSSSTSSEPQPGPSRTHSRSNSNSHSSGTNDSRPTTASSSSALLPAVHFPHHLHQNGSRFSLGPAEFLHLNPSLPMVPPAYDDAIMQPLHYGCSRDFFRHSLTLPRRTDLVVVPGDRNHVDFCPSAGGGGRIIRGGSGVGSGCSSSGNQQRFSLQFNVPGWSSASSSTLSLSTPNSPNDHGRPPSLSSSSSSNASVSTSHV